MGAAQGEASVISLLGRLAQDSGVLARQELRLVSSELSDRAKSAAGDIGLIALGGGLAHAGLLALLGAAMIGLAMVMPLWAAALIIGAVFFGGGCAVVVLGMNALERSDSASPSTPNARAPQSAAASAPEKETRR